MDGVIIPVQQPLLHAKVNVIVLVELCVKIADETVYIPVPATASLVTDMLPAYAVPIPTISIKIQSKKT
ncbi:hypothetical protein ASN18_0277 [Candidatus Magnetominusculus xianensis]|uniref:Uncharacterized protein n=1 Tax=Candidatus Magnetominusculus xianensis TaxID=1748249 RepID=A0ABR5SKC4_9BACT|nr:hypothetical protein ASN18_0277 [Candidatus Magnetominusculus xianensis]